MRKPFLIAFGLMLLTTACRAEANFLLNVAEDGSGDITIELGIDDELLELVEAFGGGADDILGVVPDGTDVVTRTEGDMTFYAGTEPFSDPTELLETAGILEEADATFQELDLVVEDGGATLNAVIETPNATETLEGLGAGDLGGFGDIGADVFTSSLVVALPGDLVETNADEILPDGRLRWDIPLLGGVVSVMAVTETAGGGFPWGLVLGILGAALVIGAAVLWVRHRQSGSVDAVEATPVPEPPSSVFESMPSKPDDITPKDRDNPIDSI